MAALRSMSRRVTDVIAGTAQNRRGKGFGNILLDVAAKARQAEEEAKKVAAINTERKAQQRNPTSTASLLSQAGNRRRQAKRLGSRQLMSA